jgi:hypothetical protein
MHATQSHGDAEEVPDQLELKKLAAAMTGLSERRRSKLCSNTSKPRTLQISPLSAAALRLLIHLPWRTTCAPSSHVNGKWCHVRAGG